MDKDGDGYVDGELTLGTNPQHSDTDGDGMNDGWEWKYGLNPLNYTDANGDPDNDNKTNLQEYNDGSNPTVYNSAIITVYEYDGLTDDVAKEKIQNVAETDLAVTEYQYDNQGKKWSVRQWSDSQYQSSTDKITLTQYDALGNVVKTAVKTELSYSGWYYDETIDETTDLVTTNTYDNLGRIVDVNDPNGGITHYAYDDLTGQLVSVTDPNGNTTSFDYDNAGRQYLITDARGHYQKVIYDSLSRRIVSYAYDCNDTPGNPADDVALSQQRTEYDNLNHTTRQIVMANASASLATNPNTNTDLIKQYVYDGQTGTYPGLLSSQTAYYGGSGANLKTAVTYFEYDALGRRIRTLDPDGNETKLFYNTAGQVYSVQQIDNDPIGSNDLVRTTSYIYDSLGRKYQQIEMPNVANNTTWRYTIYEYDGIGNLAKVTAPDNTVTRTIYNALSQLVKKIADEGGIDQSTEYSYYRAGWQKTITGYADGSTAQTTTYEYDKLGRVTKIIYPDNGQIAYQYNPGGKVIQRTDPRGLVTAYAYDPTYNMVQKQVTQDNATTTETFTYDGLGRMLSANKTIDSSSVSLVEYAYNALGKVVDSNEALFGAAKKHVDYGYDQAGTMTSMGYDSHTVAITPDAFGRIGSVSADGAAVASYQYLGQRVARRTYSTGTPVVYTPTYDNLGRMTSANSTRNGNAIARFDYQYKPNTDSISHIDYVHRGAGRYAEFAYDNLARVIQGDYKGDTLAPFNDQLETFAMDALGNRSGSQAVRGGGNVSYAVNSLTNAYTQVGSAVPTYDNAGNMTKDELGYRYYYDYENRITEIRRSDNTTVVAQFAYDALGRRIKKVDSIAATTTLYYYNTHWQVLFEKNTSGTTQRWYVYGNYIDEPLMLVIPPQAGIQKFYYVQDHLYSTAALVDSTGAVVERYEYDAYGKVQFLTSSFRLLTSSRFGNPYLFTGRNVDYFDNSALKLQYNRNRYYSSSLGRWMTRDPLGVTPNGGSLNAFNIRNQYKDGMSLYEYVSSSPVCKTDNSGLSECGFNRSTESPCPRSPEPSGRGTFYFGKTWLVSFLYTTDYVKCSNDCEYKVIRKTCNSSAKYWYSDYNISDKFGSSPKEHEEGHLDIWDNTWTALTASIHVYEGICMPLEAAMCYNNLTFWINSAYTELGWALNYEYDCAATGFSCNEAASSRKKFEEQWAIVVNKLAECSKLK